MSGRDKWVRRFSVDETAKHKNGFTIYKITSVLFPIESPEAVTVVSVWKRYSDVQRLHKGMVALHAGLHLRGAVCPLPKFSYFRRFQKEVIEERAKAIKKVLEFVAEHRLLFTSTEFVNFLQSGFPPPLPARAGGVIEAIRAALALPAEPVAPLEYPAEGGDHHAAPNPPEASTDETDFSGIPQIPIYEAANIEIGPAVSHADSFESINSIDSLNDDLYDELSKLAVEKRTLVKKKMLPDLINFDAPSCSRFEDYHTMPKNSDASSLNSTMTYDSGRSNSRVSLYSKQSVLSLSNVDSKTRTEDSYVFEAGYLLNLAARCEDARDYQRAFECYKSGIEKMLIGVQICAGLYYCILVLVNAMDFLHLCQYVQEYDMGVEIPDSDPQRRALIKEKTNKYLSYAEEIYKNHLCGADEGVLLVREPSSQLHCPVPASMLLRPYEELSLYRVLAVIGDSMMLVMHKGEQACYAMKVIQKIPNNLTEFDEYFLQRTNETRQPILPTSIPYMVPLHAYIETNSLIFLILTYAPGEKLLDYIKNYVKSVPTTPARELNLENVFCEPMKREENDNSVENKSDSARDKENCDDISVNDKSVNNNDGDEFEVLVKNSQRLLQNVDKVLNEGSSEPGQEVIEEVGARDALGTESPSHFRLTPISRNVLPPSAVCKWGAQILTALESLHNAGVICRDLNPSNVLLGDGGQVVLTYCPGWARAVSLPRLSPRAAAPAGLHAAPELYDCLCEGGEECDYWSFGALMYELLCGVPLSYYHKSVFTSHTVLMLPADLPVEEESLLTQLLTYDPAERLGHGGIDEIKNHPYFKHIDWRSVYDSWIVPG